MPRTRTVPADPHREIVLFAMRQPIAIVRQAISTMQTIADSRADGTDVPLPLREEAAGTSTPNRGLTPAVAAASGANGAEKPTRRKPGPKPRQAALPTAGETIGAGAPAAAAPTVRRRRKAPAAPAVAAGSNGSGEPAHGSNGTEAGDVVGPAQEGMPPGATTETNGRPLPPQDGPAGEPIDAGGGE